jgi:hypothetical protein
MFRQRVGGAGGMGEGRRLLSGVDEHSLVFAGFYSSFVHAFAFHLGLGKPFGLCCGIVPSVTDHTEHHARLELLR